MFTFSAKIINFMDYERILNFLECTNVLPRSSKKFVKSNHSFIVLIVIEIHLPCICVEFISIALFLIA